MFQHTAARRRLGLHGVRMVRVSRFQHTAARRRLGLHGVRMVRVSRFQHTAARRRLETMLNNAAFLADVSTHSRPKAAGNIKTTVLSWLACFNTQPPEGGWTINSVSSFPICCFNTQPPEGGWGAIPKRGSCFQRFQHTAARRRLALARVKGLYKN